MRATTSSNVPVVNYVKKNWHIFFNENKTSLMDTF